MGIEIVLYDRSPVTQKIFFHVLYHYGPVVHRVSHTDELIKQVKFHSPDIIFIDSTLSSDQNLKTQIQKESKEKNIPIILMVHKESLPQGEAPNLTKGVLKKPISAGQLRELVDHFVPKVRQNILSKHLSFPSIPHFNETSDSINNNLTKNPNKEPEVLNQQEGLKKHTSSISDGLSPSSGQKLDTKEEGGIKPVSKESLLGGGISSQLEKKPEPFIDTNTGIRPVTDTSILNNKELSYQKEEPPDLLGTKATIVDTGTGLRHSKLEKEQAPINNKDEVEAKKQPKVLEKQAKEVLNQDKKALHDIMQQTVEKIAWQVVPELAKQLITQELDKLLKEEEETNK